MTRRRLRLCSLRRPLIAAAAVVLALPAASAQTLGQGAADDISTWRVVAVLLLCLALAVFAALALRARFGGSLPALFAATSGRRLQLVETLRLSHQIDLCVVTCDGQEYLVAATAQGAQILRELPPGAPSRTGGG